MRRFVVRVETEFDVGEHTVREDSPPMYVTALTADEAREQAEQMLFPDETVVGVDEVTAEGRRT